ncbi:Uncharacterized protein TCM_003230 [Theobroma cacao]|uniref:Uncharacterized protein n=1 Tax=Theobroma cacao TaxID=3641 RepID=A0A061DMQ4_THECC|nr:Uncharacterized protein TCM_003230 [Theobroma cacao]
MPLPPRTRSSSTPFTRTSQPPPQNDMMFNLFMRIDGKLADRVEKIVKIEEKLQQLGALLHPTKETKSPKALTIAASQSSERAAIEYFKGVVSDH